MKTVVDRLRSKIMPPVLTGLPFGHVPTIVLLPVGAAVELAWDEREAVMSGDTSAITAIVGTLPAEERRQRAKKKQPVGCLG